MMEDFYIYIYLDPRKSEKYRCENICFLYEPFYVGKGSGSRWKDTTNGRNKHFKNKINKIKKSGLEPIVVKIKENMMENDSFLLEIELIKLIGKTVSKNGPLTNRTDGGEGNSGWVPSEKTRKLISEKMKGENNPMFGKYPSEKTRKLMSEKNKGENNPNYGKDFSGENAPNSTLKEQKVIEIRIDLDEGILTQAEIAKKFGVSQTTISFIKRRKTWSHIKLEGD